MFFFILYPQGQNVTAEVVKKVEPFEHALEEVIKYINTTSKVKMMVYHICDEGSHKMKKLLMPRFENSKNSQAR